jgi:hypothetical protein
MAWGFARRVGGAPRSKYGACRAEIDGITFASRREARRYAGLKLRQQVGDIIELTVQPRFPIFLAGLVTHTAPGAFAISEDRPCLTVAEYRADFSYYVAETGEFVVEDAKGFRTDKYRLKKRLVEAQYGLVIHEV